MDKTLYNTDASNTKNNVPDVQFFGVENAFKLLSKASSQEEGWMKSTKVYATSRGCFVQVSTQQRNPDGSYSLAEALSFGEGLRLLEVYEVTLKNNEVEILEIDVIKPTVSKKFLEINKAVLLYRKLI